MRVLHLYANHKWTGPADLALESVRGLVAQGHDATLALAGFVHPGMEHAMRARAEAAGIPTIEGLQLRRHLHLRSFWRDARILRSWLDAGDFDLVHTHQDGDHFVAALARARARRFVPIVRSLWDGVAPPPSIRRRFAMRRSDALTLPVAGAEAEIEALYGIPRVRQRIVAGPLGSGALAAPGGEARTRARAALRAELGLADEHRLIGITARIQARRRWDLLWDLCAELPADVQVCVLGRPDAGVFEELCSGPLRARGLEQRVHFLGYRQGDAYFEALRGLDAFTFLVPGSDATCRALREAMACALPVVVTDSGLLPRLVDSGTTGRVCPADARALAAALTQLLEDRSDWRALGEAARQHALESWAAPRIAAALAELYADVDAELSGARAAPGVHG